MLGPKLKILFLFLSKNFLVDSLSFSMPATSIIFHEFTQCPGKNDLAIVLVNTTVNQVSPFHMIISGNIVLKEIIDYPMRVKASLFKCETRVDTTCEHYTTTKFDDVCRMMPFWGSFFKNTTLPPGCPFPVGEYRIDSMSFDSYMLRLLPLYESNWKVIGRIYKNERLISCSLSKFAIRKERRKVKT